MFLSYLALFIILVVLVAVFYTFIYIHDLPHKVAKERKHPHTEAIHVACWVSLFTLHAIWPFVFIWAVAHKEPGEGPEEEPSGGGANLARRLQRMEERLTKLESDVKDSAGVHP